VVNCSAGPSSAAAANDAGSEADAAEKAKNTDATTSAAAIGTNLVHVP
jgi:hypothetical protein